MIELQHEEKGEYKIKKTPPGGLEPPTFRLTAERASQLRHGGGYILLIKLILKFFAFLQLQDTSI